MGFMLAVHVSLKDSGPKEVGIHAFPFDVLTTWQIFMSEFHRKSAISVGSVVLGDLGVHSTRVGLCDRWEDDLEPPPGMNAQITKTFCHRRVASLTLVQGLARTSRECISASKGFFWLLVVLPVFCFLSLLLYLFASLFFVSSPFFCGCAFASASTRLEEILCKSNNVFCRHFCQPDVQPQQNKATTRARRNRWTC